MEIYFAPMEGLTDSVYRRLHHQYFGGVDKYVMPFLSPTMHHSLTQKEIRELPKVGEETFFAIPQILTKNPEDFLWAAEQCRQLGYGEVNLNLGCPSGTVVAKGKGAGMLADPDGLAKFLDRIFEKSPLPISVKTRLGIARAEEFPKLLALFNQYPISCLTVHPRVRSQFYDGSVDMEMFRYAYENTALKLCYNGDITTLRQVQEIQETFPRLHGVMIGRGLLADPGMLCPQGTTVEILEAFTRELLETYLVRFGGSRNAMFRMKEHWSFLHKRFPGTEDLWKKLRKTTDLEEYRRITALFFA